MKTINWFERTFQFGIHAGMLPFFIERLEGTIFRLEKRISDLSDDLLSYQPDGKWSIKQNIGHQASLHPRLRAMMTSVDLAFFDAGHDDHHLVKINEIKRTLRLLAGD